MSWWHEFADRIDRDVPIGRQTWFRIGGGARFLCRPQSIDELSAMVSRANEEGLPVKVLGSGANVLVSDDGFDGVVVRMEGDVFRRVESSGSTVTAGAAVDMMPLSRQFSQRGLSGMECMAGIPATVGGAVRMNAGGRFGEIGACVQAVCVLDEQGGPEWIGHDDVGFGYRRTRLGNRIILSARLALTEDDPVTTRRRYDEYFAYKQESQPMAGRSAGCIFKNPPGASAGALIDRAGLKGTRFGGAVVSDRHANFIVAERDTTATDVIRLIDVVRERVRAAFGVELETEVDIW